MRWWEQAGIDLVRGIETAETAAEAENDALEE